MQTGLRELSHLSLDHIAGGCFGCPPTDDPINDPHGLGRQVDISNRIIDRWMQEDPVFAAQIHQANGNSLVTAGMNGDWVIGPDGYPVPEADAQALIEAGLAELDLARGAPPPSH